METPCAGSSPVTFHCFESPLIPYCFLTFFMVLGIRLSNFLSMLTAAFSCMISVDIGIYIQGCGR